MAAPLPDTIVLGHNNFFGVDHMSATRGAERAAYFSDPSRILDVVRASAEHGAGGMMMSTHERAGPVCGLIRDDKALSRDFTLYPLLPYAQKYVTRANEMGLLNVVLEALSGAGMKEKAAMVWAGGKGIVTKDVNGMLAALIRLELKPFQGLNVPAVFLHDALTDLLLGLKLRSVFEFYMQEVPAQIGAVGAFATKNFPSLVESFKGWGFPAPVVLAHFNKAGFHMNPSRKECENATRDNAVHIMAMGTLASGLLSPEDAYAYLGTVANVDSVVVGVSTSVHVEETFAAIHRHMPVARTAA